MNKKGIEVDHGFDKIGPYSNQFLLNHMQFGPGLVAILASAMPVSIAVIHAGLVGGIDNGEGAQLRGLATIAGSRCDRGPCRSFRDIERDTG